MKVYVWLLNGECIIWIIKFNIVGIFFKVYEYVSSVILISLVYIDCDLIYGNN